MRLDLLASWLAFFCIWLTATMSLDVVALASGLALTFAVAHWAVRHTSFWTGLDLRHRRFVAGARYLSVFLKEMIVSNVAVLRYVYAPKVEISSKVVSAPLSIVGPRERLFLTNTIALTPGTLAIDMIGDRLDVHVLDEKLVGGVNPSVQKFEKLLEQAVG